MATGITNPPELQPCWSCSAQVTAGFCRACGKVQPAAPVDFFAFFGLPRKLDLDVQRLEQEFYKLSRKLHPDVFARAGAQEQQWSLEQSSHLNDAYRTLRDPIERTEYLLQLEGLKPEEQSQAATQQARATGTEKKQIVPPDLLEEVFELNLQLEEARRGVKLGERDEHLTRDLEAHQGNLQARLSALGNELKSYWDEWDTALGAGETSRKKDTLAKMLGLLNRRSYIRNLLRDVKEALEN